MPKKNSNQLELYSISEDTITEIKALADRVGSMAVYPPDTKKQLQKAYKKAMEAIADVLNGAARHAARGTPIHPELVKSDVEFHLKKIPISESLKRRDQFEAGKGHGQCRTCRKTSDSLDSDWLCPNCR